MSAAVDCFYCNAFISGNQRPCPGNQEKDIALWKSSSNRYFSYNNKWKCRIIILTGDHLISSVTLYDGTIINQVCDITKTQWFISFVFNELHLFALKNLSRVFQGAVPSCTNNDQEPVRINSNKFVTGKKLCCTNSGCNWNVSTGLYYIELDQS